MEVHEVHPADREIERQVCLLLQQHRRITFLALADALPAYSWRSLFLALHRLCCQRYVGLLPLAEDYEVLWLDRRAETRRVSEEPCLRM